jgi:hypothetical protein
MLVSKKKNEPADEIKQVADEQPAYQYFYLVIEIAHSAKSSKFA